MKKALQSASQVLGRSFQGAFLLLVTAVLLIAAKSDSSPTEVFLNRIFEEPPPSPSVHWMAGEDREIAGQILGHDYRHLRQRYWTRAGRTVWILDEIGKEKPITVAIVVTSDGIEELQVLVYREDRGGEVQFAFFTEQFTGATLESDMGLSQRIDGISGATLSVRALTNLSRLALYLHGQVTPERPSS